MGTVTSVPQLSHTLSTYSSPVKETHVCFEFIAYLCICKTMSYTSLGQPVVRFSSFPKTSAKLLVGKQLVVIHKNIAHYAQPKRDVMGLES